MIKIEGITVKEACDNMLRAFSICKHPDETDEQYKERLKKFYFINGKKR